MKKNWRINVKKFLSIVFICLSFSVFATEFNDDIDPELLEYVNNLNDEDYFKESKIINELYTELFSLEEKTGIDFSKYNNMLIPYDDNFKNLKLSEKQKIMQANAKVKDEMTDKIIDLYKKDISIGEKVYKLIREINYHENRIFEIVLKIAKASNDNTLAATDLLAETQSNLISATTKLNLAETNVKLLNEALAYQEQKNKNAYILGNIIIPVVGLPFIFTSAMLVANSNENSLVSPDFANTLLYSSIFLTIGCEVVWNGGHLVFKWW